MAVGSGGRVHGSPGCCSSPHTRRCCIATTVIGGILSVLGILLLVAGKDYLSEKILHSMSLSPGSKRLATWLVPPVQAHLTGYGFSVTNPAEVMQGEKPILKEVGPFVYKAVTIKDSVDEVTKKSNLVYEEDGQTLTYRPRKFYYLDRKQSKGGNPDTTYLTVPNIPMLTVLNKVKDWGFSAGIAAQVVINAGLGTPFINISFTGLLWGYDDEMPCMKMDKPSECQGSSLFAEESTDDVLVEESTDDDWDDWYDDDVWKRKKRSIRYKRETQEVNAEASKAGYEGSYEKKNWTDRDMGGSPGDVDHLKTPYDMTSVLHNRPRDWADNDSVPVFS